MKKQGIEMLALGACKDVEWTLTILDGTAELDTFLTPDMRQ